MRDSAGWTPPRTSHSTPTPTGSMASASSPMSRRSIANSRTAKNATKCRSFSPRWDSGARRTTVSLPSSRWLGACVGRAEAARLRQRDAARVGLKGVGNMAQIVLGLGTSHGPQLFLKPEQWELRAEADRQNKQHWFRGKAYDFPALEALRGVDGFATQITLPAK